MQTKIESFRKQAGLSQADVAKKAAMPRQQYKRIENNEVSPTLNSLQRIAGALGCSAKDLLIEAKKRSTWVLVNLKGGVGKTTQTIIIAQLLSELGYKTVILDNDPQASITGIFIKWLLLHDEKQAAEIHKQVLKHNIYTLMKGDSVLSDCLLKNDKIPFQVIGATEKFKDAPTFFQDTPGKDNLQKIKLSSLDCDFLIIDTPGTFNANINWSLAQADQVIVPIETDILSIDPLPEVIARINQAKTYLNPEISSIHLLPNKLDYTTVCRLTLDALNQEYRSYLFYSDNEDLFSVDDKKAENSQTEWIVGVHNSAVVSNFIAGLQPLPKKGKSARIYQQCMTFIERLLP
ncbi:MAG: AAA family ATPase [SAR324 cluster bacterium]|nr:AAA family ATPase [SAR324 cluster bacterium]